MPQSKGNHLLALFILFVIACGCETGIKSRLLVGQWKVMMVENANSGQGVPDALYNGTLWDFRSDSTFTFDVNNDVYTINRQGIWKLNGDYLTVIQDKDTTKLKIEKLTDTELTWLMTKENTLRFYLTTVTQE